MKFSLVIPLAPGRNAEVIDSIKKTDYPKKEYEIIVKEGLNPSNNRNEGAKKARGKIIAFLDDDAIIDKNLLRNAEEFFEKYREIDIVGGAQLTPEWQKGFARISGYALSSKFGAWKMGNRYSKQKLNLNADETMLTSANLFCRREVMNKIQFDSNLFPGEDPKFVEEAKKAGLRVAYSPDLILYHKRRETTKALIKQIASYGRTRTIKENFLSTLKRPFFLIPSLFIVYLFLLLIFIILEFFKINSIPNLEILSLPLVLYVGLDLIFSFYEAVKNKHLTALILLIFVFPIIHLSYGFGMIKGYLEKLSK
jgi:succinoglycan biosynthesis protein ExoA